MKYFIIITLTIALVQWTNCQGESDESLYDYGDDARGFDDSLDDSSEEEHDKPIYNLKDAANLFKKYVIDYNKKYKNEKDYEKHYQNFVKNLKEINRLNSNKEYSSTSDINLFTDLSPQERLLFLGGSSK